MNQAVPADPIVVGQQWTATSGHWAGDQVEVFRVSATNVNVKRLMHGGRKAIAVSRSAIPRDYFLMHYELRQEPKKNNATKQAKEQKPVSSPTPPLVSNGASHEAPPQSAQRSRRWRVRYRLDIQEVEITGATLLDVASEMEHFAPGCEVVSAEQLDATS